MKYQNVMIATMIKDSAQWLPNYWESMKALDYPKKKLRIVFMYGKSNDETLELLKKYKKENIVPFDVFEERRDPSLKQGSFTAASIYNEYRKLLKNKEDYVLFMDSDVVFSPDLLTELLKVDADIVAPYIWAGNRYFYDSFMFRINNRNFDSQRPAGLGKDYPIEVDSVGTCFLNKREVWANIPSFNPYPEISYCAIARKCGYQVVAVPYIGVKHVDVRKHRELLKRPLDKSLGGHPTGKPVNSMFTVTRYKKKTKRELNRFYKEKLEKVEAMIEKEAKAMLKVPEFKKQGLEWCKNKTHMKYFFATRNSEMINLMYKTQFLPPYVEIELSNLCPYKCRMCERTYIDWEEPRKMSWKEFLHIMKEFTPLRQVSFTGIGDVWNNPIFLDAVKYVKQEKHAYLEQYDGFQVMTPKVAKKFVDWNVDRMLVSLDAGTKETYEKFRVGMKWDKMVTGIQNLLEARKKANSLIPTLSFHFVINKANQDEVLEVIDFAKSFKDWKQPKIFYNRILHNFKEIDDLYMDISEDMRRNILTYARREGVAVSFNAPTGSNLPPLGCCTDYWQPFIFVNGDVVLCCCQHESNRRQWEMDMRMGNIFEQSLKSMWKSPRWKQIRKLLYQNKLPEACVDCPTYNWKGYDNKPIKLVDLK